MVPKTRIFGNKKHLKRVFLYILQRIYNVFTKNSRANHQNRQFIAGAKVFYLQKNFFSVVPFR